MKNIPLKSSLNEKKQNIDHQKITEPQHHNIRVNSWRKKQFKVKKKKKLHDRKEGDIKIFKGWKLKKKKKTAEIEKAII